MDGRAVHVFELAIRLSQEKKVNLDGMMTHKFRLDQFQDMIELNMNKAENKAVKTAISFV